jgi:hypothetical protein
VQNGDNQKWTLLQEGYQWRLRNVVSGLWLRVNDPAQGQYTYFHQHILDANAKTLYLEGTPVIAGPEPFEWDIWPDEGGQPMMFR